MQTHDVYISGVAWRERLCRSSGWNWGIHPQFGAPPSNMIRGGVAGYGHVAYLGMRSMAKIAIDVRSAQEWKRP